MIAIVLMAVSGCDVFDKPEQIPSYIYVDRFTLTTDVGTEGENTENITDGWVFVDGTLIGAFELPARVPIQNEGQHAISIVPGIKNNGISGERKTYPFYVHFDTTLTLVRGQVDSLSPNTQYTSGLDFTIEDFESAGVIMQEHATSDTTWVVETGGPTGDYGKIVLEDPQFYAYLKTDGNHNFPKQGERVYLEIDVKSNNTINLGIIDEISGGENIILSDVVINRTDNNGETAPEWKKIYVELTNTVSFESQAVQHEFFFQIFRHPETSTSEVCLDNIKIVHF